MVAHKRTEAEPSSERFGTETAGKFRTNNINSIANDDLAPCVTKCSANIILAMCIMDGIVNLNTLHPSVNEFYEFIWENANVI